MLVFIDSRLEIAPTLLNAWAARDHGVSIFTGTSDGSHWLEVIHTERRTLEATLENHIENRPSINKILLFWKDAEPLAAFTTVLSRLLRSYRVECAAVVSDADTTTDFPSVFDPKKSAAGENVRFVDNLAFVGNEDSRGEALSPLDRKRHVASLLQLVLEGGETIAAELGFFRKEEHPLLAFGLYSGLRSHDSVESAVRLIANRLLIEGFEKEAKRNSTLGDDFKKRAVSSLERTKSLALPKTLSIGAVEKEWTDTVEDTRSPSPWKCPWLRFSALESGRNYIRRQFTEIRKDRRKFLDLVVTGAAMLRENGQTVFEQELKEKADWITDNPSLGRFSALLLKHFSEYEELNQMSRQETKSPCIPLSHPDENLCHQKFHDELVETLEDLTGRLFSEKTWGILAAINVVAITAAWFVFRHGATRVAIWLACGTTLVTLAFCLRNWYVSRKISAALRREYEESCDWLALEMRAKLDWVLQKTRLTLQAQIVAANIGIARRLNYGLNVLLREWDDLKNRLGSGTVSNGSETINPEEAGLADYENQLNELFAELSRNLAERAVKNQGIHEPLTREFESIVFQSYRHATSRPTETTELRAALDDCAGDRLSPPISARVNKASLARGIRKCFFIPASWSPDIDAAIEKRSNTYPTDSFSTVRSEISGPFVWISKPNLSVDEALRALEQQTIGA